MDPLHFQFRRVNLRLAAPSRLSLIEDALFPTRDLAHHKLSQGSTVMAYSSVQLFSLLLWSGTESLAFVASKKCHRFRTLTTTSQKMSLEVEQKFQLSDLQNLESRLKLLGFVPSGRVLFVDWYFDTARSDLSLQDYWLRFREKAGEEGNWELKRGSGHNSSSTVYEEIEGQDAVSIALSMISVDECTAPTYEIPSFEGFDAPQFAGLENEIPLYPFCRIETSRSRWETNLTDPDNAYLGLVVDLDETNTGHAVGEVEMVVEDASRVADAKRRVQELVAKLIEGVEPPDSPAVGKLEHFLMTQRPDHYAACVRSGVIRANG